MLTLERPRRLLGVALALVAVLVTGVVRGDTPRTDGPQTLQEALEALRSEGFGLVFTSELVPPDLRVLVEPENEDPRRRLDVLLAPHGLTVREVAGGRLIVVRAPRRPATLQGQVFDTTGEPLAGAVVWVERDARRTLTNPEGRFVLGALESGPLTVEARASGYRPRRLRLVLLEDERRQAVFRLEALPPEGETIEVVGEWPWVVSDGISTSLLEQRHLTVLPHFADDVFRGLETLPGTTSSDGSAHLHVRGGEQRELLVRLDGFELVEPFHLPDFNDALTVFRPETLDRAELVTGGFGVEFGDRMAGVLDLTTLVPSWDRQTQVALSPVSVDVGSSGRRKQPRGPDGPPPLAWLANARFGSLEIPFQITGDEENPSFWDLFAKAERETTASRGWRAHLLAAGDQLDFAVRDDGVVRERFRTRYRNLNGWVSHHRPWRRHSTLDLRLGASLLERDRQGLETEDSGSFDLDDRRELEMASIALDGRSPWGPDRTWRWGGEVRSLEASYDYQSQRTPGSLVATPQEDLRFDQRFDGDQLAAYVSGRQLGERWTVEAGVRFDRNTLLDDAHLSPRLSLTWQPTPNRRWRAAWGHYSQSQRLYELQVEDGETTFSPTERARSWGLAYEQSLEVEGGSLDLRLEIYQRRLRNPRPRWENLFDPLGLAPELAGDRFQVVAERTLAEGFELFLGGQHRVGRRERALDWFFTYTHATVEDRLGTRWVPRAIDQPDALGLDLILRDLGAWDLALIGRWHTGWPTTSVGARIVTAATGATEIVPELGPLRQERLPDYARVDLRASRHFHLPWTDLELSLEVRNLANSTNLRGFDISFEPRDDGTVAVTRDPETWGGRLPMVTLRARF